MSKLFGPIRQLGYVVDEIEAATRYWTQTLRIGPFYHTRSLTTAGSAAKNAGTVPARIALGYSGNLMIALIQPLIDDGVDPQPPGAAAGSCLHHFGFFSENIRRDLQRASETGLDVSQIIRFGIPEGRMFILHGPGQVGPMSALIELNDATRNLLGMVRNEAMLWDGSGPLRVVGA